MIPNDFCSLDQKGHQSGCSIMDCFPHARVLCNLESFIVLQAHFFLHASSFGTGFDDVRIYRKYLMMSLVFECDLILS